MFFFAFKVFLKCITLKKKAENPGLLESDCIDPSSPKLKF